MAITLKRNSADISSSVDWRSIDLSLVLTKEVSTLDFEVLKTPAASVPVVGDQIDLYDGSAHLFGGTVTESLLTIEGGILPRYHITVTDWSYQFDAMNVTKTYTGEDPGTIVADIISNFTAGFTGVNVASAGYTIPSIRFNHQPPTKCIQKIAQLIGWDWYIDPDKDVHFFLGDIDDGVGGGVLAPFNLNDTSGNLEWPTIDYAVNAQNLKNSVYVIGSTYKKSYDATTAIDVYKTQAGQQTYPLVYPYDPDTLTVTLAGVSQTVGTYGKDDPGSFDVLYSNATGAPPFIVFSSDPGAAHMLKVFGDADVPILGYANDAASVATYGEFQDTIVDKQITTYQEAQQRALAEVLQYGQPLTDLKFNTLKTGLMIGQTITLNSTILGVTVTLTIQRIRAMGRSPSQLEYRVEAIGGDKVRFTDIMAVLLEQELNQNSVDDTTILQVLLRIVESLALSDGTPAVYAASGPYVWGAGWDWRVPITVPAGKVSSDITGFPVYIDLSTLPAAFFTGGLDEHGVFHAGVKSDGSDIRVYKSDNATQVPVEVVAINTSAKTGEVWFKGDLTTAADTTFYLWFGNAAATLPAAGSTYGSQNVWSDYTNIYHLSGSGNDSAAAGNNISSLKEVTQASDSLSFPGEVLLDSSLSGNTALAFGTATGNQKIAQSFVMGPASTAQIDTLLRRLANTGTLAASVVVAIQADSSGSPSGTNIASTTLSNTSWNAGPNGADNIVWTTGSLTSLVQGTTYWLVLSQSANDDSNHANVAYDATASHGVLKGFNGSSWGTITGALRYAIYKSGYAQLTSNITPAIQDMGVSFRLKKTDTNYEDVLSQNSLGNTTGHLEINGSSAGASAGRVTYRPVSGNQVSVLSGVNTADGQYHWYTWVRDATSSRLYIDGVLIGSTTTDATGTNQFEKFGAIQGRLNATYSTALNGNLKEVRFSTASLLTAARIAASYLNQNSPASFYNVGSIGLAYPKEFVWGFSTWS